MRSSLTHDLRCGKSHIRKGWRHHHDLDSNTQQSFTFRFIDAHCTHFHNVQDNETTGHKQAYHISGQKCNVLTNAQTELGKNRGTDDQITRLQDTLHSIPINYSHTWYIWPTDCLVICRKWMHVYSRLGQRRIILCTVRSSSLQYSFTVSYCGFVWHSECWSVCQQSV